MDLGIRGHVALVTGEGRGIGEAVALRLAEEGYRVALCDLDLKPAEDVAARIRAAGGEALAMQVDVAKYEDAGEVVSRTVAHFGNLHILVNNAGFSRDAPITEMTEQAWDAVVNACLKGTWAFSQAAARHMVGRNYGRIVNIASRAHWGEFNKTNYASAKAGVVGLSRALALELAPHEITVDTIAPGLIRTERVKALKYHKDIDRRAKRARLSSVPASRRTSRTASLFWRRRARASSHPNYCTSPAGVSRPAERVAMTEAIRKPAAHDPAAEVAPGLSAYAWHAICRHTADRGMAIAAGSPPLRCSGGLANRNYEVRLASGDRAILRMPPPGKLPPGANDMAREHRILANLWKALPLAPHSFLHCGDMAVAGMQFHLLEFREGIAVRGDGVAPLPATPATGARLSELAIEVLARVHRVPPAEAGLHDLGRPQGFLSRTEKGWIDRAAIVFGGQIDGDMRHVAEWLSAARLDGLGGDATLLHNDFKLDNLLLGPATLEASAILDWDMGTRGGGLMDLAALLSYWTEAGDPECMHRLAQMPTARPGFFSREQAASRYAQVTNRSLEGFHLYRVLGMFRLSVVFLQLHARWRSGEVTDARYAGFGELAREIAGFARSIADGRMF